VWEKLYAPVEMPDGSKSEEVEVCGERVLNQGTGSGSTFRMSLAGKEEMGFRARVMRGETIIEGRIVNVSSSATKKQWMFFSPDWPRE